MSSVLEEHFGYLSDRVKADRYKTVIDRLVRPEHTVLDLGCGSGVLGLMALRAGAQKVFFIEEGVILEAARQTVVNAGFADKAEFIQSNSFQLRLPEQVDIILCDHVGYFGFDYGILELLADARQRFLKPDGVIIPAEFELKLAPIGSDECRKLVGQWHDGSVDEEFGWLGAAAANSKHSVNLKLEDLLADGEILATLQLGTEIPPFLSWSVEFDCARDGMLDGVAGWFDCLLFDNVRMSNSPGIASPLKRSQAFLPLAKPVSVSAGERVKVTVMIRHRDHVIGWIIELPDSGQRFAQTTFNGLLLDRESLTRAHPERIATLSDRGKARQLVLSYCDGKRTLAEVESLVLRDFPQLFPSTRATSTFITAVLASDTCE
jgi:SAM-dependent methyltransferase